MEDSELISFFANPYFDEVLIFFDQEEVKSSQEKYKPIKIGDDFLYQKKKTNTVQEYINKIQEILKAKQKDTRVYEGNIFIQISISGSPKKIKITDIDNMIKTLFDAISGVVIKDDRMINTVYANKYKTNGNLKGFFLCIKVLKENETPKVQEFVISEEDDIWKDDPNKDTLTIVDFY